MLMFILKQYSALKSVAQRTKTKTFFTRDDKCYDVHNKDRMSVANAS